MNLSHLSVAQRCRLRRFYRIYRANGPVEFARRTCLEVFENHPEGTKVAA